MRISYQSPSGPMDVELTEGGLVLTYAQGRVEVPYANLTAMTLADQLYLYAGPQSVLPIPLSAFGSQEQLNAFGRALLERNPALSVSADQSAAAQPGQSRPESRTQMAAPDEGDDDDRQSTEAVMAEIQKKYFRPDGRPGCFLLFRSLLSFLKIITIGRFRALQPPTEEETEDFFTEAVRVEDARSLYEAALAKLAEGRLWAYTEVEGLEGDRRCLVSLDFDGHQEQPMTREQAAAYEYMKQNFPRLKPLIIQALMEANRHMRQQAKADYQARGGKVLQAAGGLLMPPDIKSPDKFEKLLQTPRWELRREQKDGLAYVAVCYNPHWTVNTEGLILHGDRIVFVGSDPDFAPLSD